MKFFLRPALSAMISLSLAIGITPFTVFADDTQSIETGVIDFSDEQLILGENNGISLNLPDVTAVSADDSVSGKGWLLGDYLDANNKAVYAEMAKLVTPTLDSITVQLPEPVEFTASSMITSNSPELYNAVFGSCSSAFNAVLFDMPEIFWVDHNKISVSPDEVRYSYNFMKRKYTYTLSSLTITPSCYSTFADLDEIIEYKGLLEKAVADFEVEGDTTVEKLKDIHDKIANFTYYDMTADFSGSALGSLVTSGSVCESYAKGFKLICDRENIPCVCVFGNYNADEQAAHMWNYVLMEDNCWYAVDVTWDDKDGRDGIEVADTYFMKGSDDFNTNHTPCESYSTVKLKYPELAEWNYGENPATATTTTTSTKSTTTATKTTTISTKATTTTSPEKEFEYGDLNHDGKISIADLVYCSYHVLGVEEAEYSCDLNNDNRVDVFDVVIMRQITDKLLLQKN